MYESGENYLETILILEKRNGSVRSVDIARELSFSKPSVSRAIKILKNSKFIIINSDGIIKMTKEGRKKAESIYEKHQWLTEFLILTTGVSSEIAESDACKIEHIISEETFRGVKEYIKNRNKE